MNDRVKELEGLLRQVLEAVRPSAPHMDGAMDWRGMDNGRMRELIPKIRATVKPKEPRK